MIINFPTGLYKTVLPSTPSVRGNVTYTISNDPPPRTNLLFPKVPKGIVDRKKSVKTIDIITRRTTQGELIYTVNSSSRSEEGNNSKTFEIGQVLEFGVPTVRTVDPMFVANKTETRHDMNRFDYAELGFTDSDVEMLNTASLLKQVDLSAKLNDSIQNRANAEIEIANQQKIINDTTRNIDALAIVLDGSGSDPAIQVIYDKFVARRELAFAKRDIATTNANKYAAEAARYKDDLNKVSTVVK